MNILYFLQRPREISLSVYKIGLSTQGLNRFKAADYRDAEIILISQVDNVIKQEKELIELFNLNFKKAKQVYKDKTFGDEDYYITDVQKAKKIFMEYILNQPINIKQNELNFSVIITNIFIYLLMLFILLINLIINFIKYIQKLFKK